MGDATAPVIGFPHRTTKCLVRWGLNKCPDSRTRRRQNSTDVELVQRTTSRSPPVRLGIEKSGGSTFTVTSGKGRYAGVKGDGTYEGVQTSAAAGPEVLGALDVVINIKK